MTTPIRVYLERLRHYAGTDNEPRVYICGNYAEPDGRRVDMGLLGLGQAWWEVPLPSCPDCGNPLAWAEAGRVPGARKCTGCGSLFIVRTEAAPDAPVPAPEVFDYECDQGHAHRLTEAQARTLEWKCPRCGEPFV